MRVAAALIVGLAPTAFAPFALAQKLLPRRAANVTERFQRMNFGQLDIEFDEPKACTKPFAVRVDQRTVADGSEMIEFI